MPEKKEIQNRYLVYKKFQDLRNYLEYTCYVYGGKRKIVNDVIRYVENNKNGTENSKIQKEKFFCKLFLFPALNKYFEKNDIDVIREGTRFSNKFFGSFPSADFFFEKNSQTTLFNPMPDKVPFLLETVGEVKFEKLGFRLFAGGLGQLIGYLRASKYESKFKTFGLYIFFNTDIGKGQPFSEEEKEKRKRFFREISNKENIFFIIL